VTRKRCLCGFRAPLLQQDDPYYSTWKTLASLVCTIVHYIPSLWDAPQYRGDRGSQWASEYFRSSLATNWASAPILDCVPSDNGLVERTNEVVEAALRHYVSPDQNDWHKHLPFIEFALNNAYHKTIQATPFRMNRITLPLNL
jgi:hypothetical protein